MGKQRNGFTPFCAIENKLKLPVEESILLAVFKMMLLYVISVLAVA